MKMKKSLVISCLILLIGLNLAAQNAKSGYSVVNKIHLPGDGGWDYLTVEETGSGRLFVSHGTVVQVIDFKTGTALRNN